MNTNKKKIAVAVTHRTPYGRLRPIMKAIQENPNLELQVMVGSSVFRHHLFFALRNSDIRSIIRLLPFYFRSKILSFFFGKSFLDKDELLAKMIIQDGFSINERIPIFLEGGNLTTMTKSVGAGIFNLPKILETLKPDIVLVHADRFEMLSIAIASSLMNIPIAHTQGGDVSGTIDETVRHAITKLAHIHFPTTNKSKERLIRMGENPNSIFMVGCPTIDVLKKIDLNIDENIYIRNGVGYGKEIDLTKPFLLMLHHPVTTEYALTKTDMQEVLESVRTINMPILLFWSNIDAGSDGASEAIREFIKNPYPAGLTLYKSFNSEDFYRALNASAVAVGNSSSFIREGSYLGTPSVVVGSRQNGREYSKNIIEVECKREKIIPAIKIQLSHGKYKQSNIYGDGNASEKIANILATVNPSAQKKFYEEYLPISI